MPAPGAWRPPSRLDEYRLVGPIGAGATGQVWLAEDTLLQRAVAIKFLAIEPDAGRRERFYAEARAVARISHPNVVAVHRVGEVGRRPYLVTEYVRGRALSALETPVPWRRALEIGVGLARGLSVAHRRGVLHRDIKPANAMISDEGEIKLVDFGLARLLDAAGPASAPPGEVAAAEDEEEGRATRSRDRGAPEDAGAPQQALAARPSAFAGTPLYMPPETWRGEAAERSGDVYSLGALLFELCAGRAPFDDVPFESLGEAVTGRDAPPLLTLAPAVEARFAAIIDRCLARDPRRRPPSGDALREALEALALGGAGASVPEGNPYRGLRAFEAADRALFFGRGAEARAVIDRLRDEPFVLVAGDSGAGKSSLVEAAVLPLAAEGALDPARPVRTARLVPGRRPLLALAAALAPHLDRAEAEVEQLLRREPDALVRALAAVEAVGLLLFIDQMEELVTLSDPVEAGLVAEALGAAIAARGRLRVVGAARGDFLARLAALPSLGDEISRAIFLLRPLSAGALREAITGPAAAAGARFESEVLVDSLVASGQGGGLPLLQFALSELWRARREGDDLIPAAALAAMGGVEGALARHADGVIEALLPAERAAARRVLLRLVTAEGTRSRRAAVELGVDPGDERVGRAALEALVRGRLVVARAGEDGAHGTYELAHEALIDRWGTLREWLSGEEAHRAARQRLERAAAEWERLGRGSEGLWGGRLLDEVDATAAADGTSLGERERAFLAASRRARRAGRLSRAALAAIVPLVLAGAWGAVDLRVRHERDRAIAGHVAAADAALAEAAALDPRVESLRRDAFARFDAVRIDDGEHLWAEARARAQAQARVARAAARELEAALLVGVAREDLRRRLGEALLEGARLAERDGRASDRDELLDRLGSIAPAARRAWDAPARLSLSTTPAGARVTLHRYDRASHPFALSAPEPLGVTPLGPIERPPGSYLVEITAPGRPTVRYPLFLARGESRHLDVPLPASVPAGFIYVPPGRFLYGSDDDEGIRAGMFLAQPLHPVELGPYLIARHEVTFADFIAFLRELPPDERRRRRPHANHDEQGAVELRDLVDGDFELTMQPGKLTYRVRAGQPVRYQGRDANAVQDWTRFPVSGINLDDALAYLAWLDRTGRVRGARLCDEREWEHAATGAGDRRFPHGDRLEPADAAYDLTYRREPTAWGPDEVGRHPRSDSPFGVADLVGNGGEFVRALDPGEISYRGGSWYRDAISNRPQNRYSAEPGLRTNQLGLRVCAGVTLE